MSFKSALSEVGHVLAEVFTLGIVAAKAAEPYIDVAFPGVAPLFESIVTAAGNAETSAIAAGKQNGTGAQKLQFVLASVQESIAEYEKTNNITTPMAQTNVEAIANAVVAFLNNLPAKTTVTPTPTVAPTT